MIQTTIKNIHKFFLSILNKIMNFWVKVQFIPENPKETFKLQSNIPVVYVLSHNSLSDKLIVYSICHKLNLPLPIHKNLSNIFNTSHNMEGGIICLNKLGLLQAINTYEQAPKNLIDIFTKVENEEFQKDVMFIPTTIIWGRDPGKINQSWFKLLFNDDENAGIFQKFLIILAQGKDVFLHFGNPISIKEQIKSNISPHVFILKLREHFKAQRQIVLGPKLYDQTIMIKQLFQSQYIQELIEIESKKTGQTRNKIENKILRYIKEISAAQNYSTLRFLNLILTYVLKKLFVKIETQNIQQIREISQTHSLVYVPAHRSYFDFLALPYVLYQNGLKTPHFAAGINLNFWPVGGLLRKGGAFFIKRTFKGNKLYAKVLYEYINLLMQHSYPICFFPEGQRSRIGKSLQPKTGMLSMIVQGYLRDKIKPIAFVPVYIGYDNVIEIKSYIKELSGQSKKNENFIQLLKAKKIFKNTYGKIYINFASPIILEDFLKANYSAHKNLNITSEETKPLWYTELIQKLAYNISQNINNQASITPTSVVASVLTSLPQKSLPEQELKNIIDDIITLIKNSVYKNKEYLIPIYNPEQIIKYTEQYSYLKRFNYPESDILYIEERDSIKMTYYKNNIMHILAMPSIIASCFKYAEMRTIESVINISSVIYNLIKNEFFLTSHNVTTEINSIIELMLKLEILKHTKNKGIISRPSILSSDFIKYKIISAVLSTTIQKYAIAILVLNNLYEKFQKIKIQKFNEHYGLILKRIYLLEGFNDSYLYNTQNFTPLLEYLKSLNYIFLNTQDQNTYIVNQSIKFLQPILQEYFNQEFIDKIKRLQ